MWCFITKDSITCLALGYIKFSNCLEWTRRLRSLKWETWRLSETWEHVTNRIVSVRLISYRGLGTDYQKVRNLLRIKVKECCPCAHYMEVYGGKRDITPVIFSFGSGWRLVVSFRSQPYYPDERGPSTHWTGDFLGPGADLYTSENRKISGLWKE
jgi:hypothetical protein